MRKQTILWIEGMVCTNCEKRVAEALMAVTGVEYAKVDFNQSKAYVTYDDEKTDATQFAAAVRKSGYELLKEGKKGADKSIIPWILLLLGGFYIINNTIGFNFIPEVTAEMGYGLLFMVGVLTSFHCIAMCGGIALSQGLHPHSGGKKGVSSLLYNIGRVMAYTLVGGIVGGLGAVVSPSGQFKGIVAVMAGLFMVLMGLKMLNILTLPIWLRLRLPHLSYGKANISGPLRPLAIGFLNGFMPCGPLQTMQLYALGTGSVVQGALSMFFFSLGTVPLMLAFGFISSVISKGLGNKMVKASALLVMMLGVMMVNRGFALSGIAPNFGQQNPSVAKSDEIRMEDGKQIIDLTIGARSYIPSVRTAQIGIPLRINLDVQSINGCNNPISIPGYGIQKDLTSGESFIEFIPTQEGPITITCWMGMITTRITAVKDMGAENIEGTKSQRPKAPEAPEPFFGGGDACCGGGIFQVENAAGKAVINGKGQTVEMEVSLEGYGPNILVVQKGLETRWVIDAKELSNCTYQLAIPDANFIQTLKEGRNEIRFTPEKTGEIYFSCGMGMLYGKIVIVDDIEKVDLNQIENTSVTPY
ncbi:MAG: sulfite exporter TauE/SafE family protein [Thermotaleaceae bacterium]